MSLPELTGRLVEKRPRQTHDAVTFAFHLHESDSVELRIPVATLHTAAIVVHVGSGLALSALKTVGWFVG